MVFCHARFSSTEARPLCSVVMTSVGQAMLGMSGVMSTQAMVAIKPTCDETAVRPMNFVHHSAPSAGK